MEDQKLEERRRSRRFRIPFKVDVLPSRDAAHYVTGDIRDFSPDGFSFESVHIDLGTNSPIKARFLIDPGSDYISVNGRIAWKIKIGVETQVGVEIDELDTRNNTDLGYPFCMWEDKIKKH